jgi:hypothetical protein
MLAVADPQLLVLNLMTEFHLSPTPRHKLKDLMDQRELMNAALEDRLMTHCWKSMHHAVLDINLLQSYW